MDLYSINDLDINVDNLKNSYIDYGPNALAISHNVKISNPPKKYDYSKWVKKTNKKDLQFLLAYPSVSVLPNRSKYSDLASTYVEFNLLVFEKGEIILYLDANGFDEHSKSCLVSCDIPDSELYFGNDISSYVSKVPLSNDRKKISSRFSFNLDTGLHKIRVHIDEDGFNFRSIFVDQKNIEMATFVSKKYREGKITSGENPTPSFAKYSRNLMELQNEEEQLDYIQTEENEINNHLININDKLDNIILQNAESDSLSNKPASEEKEKSKNDKGMVFNQYITENVKNYKKDSSKKNNVKKNNAKKNNVKKNNVENIIKQEDDSESNEKLMFKISDDISGDISEIYSYNVDKSNKVYKTYNFYILILVLFILFFIYINEDSSILPFSYTPTPSPEFLNSSTEF